MGNTSDANNGYQDQDDYTIRTWLGLLGPNASTTIIDTSLYGDITIEITLAPSDVLMLSQTTPELTSYNAKTNSEIGRSTAAGTTPANTPSQGTGYTISSIGFQITRYDMPQSYYQAVAGVLESGAVFKLYYLNYSTFMGTAQSLPKGGTTRFNISTQSLDMVISTFQVQDRGTQQAPILGLWSNNGVGCLPNDGTFGIDTTSPSTGLINTTLSAGEFGTYLKIFNHGLTQGWGKTLNNSKYFVRNGDGINTCTYIVGNVRIIPETIPERFNGVLRARNGQNDTLGGSYPGIQSLGHYQSQFYPHRLGILCGWGRRFPAISDGPLPVLILEQNIIEAPFINSMLFLLISPEFDIIRLGAMLASARRGQWAREEHEQNNEKSKGWFIPCNKSPRLPEITIKTKHDEDMGIVTVCMQGECITSFHRIFTSP